MNNQVIIATIHALAAGMHKSWVAQDFVDEFNKITGMNIASMAEMHGVHKAARKALRDMGNVFTPYGWSNEHVAVLVHTFAAYARYSDPQ